MILNNFTHSRCSCLSTLLSIVLAFALINVTGCGYRKEQTTSKQNMQKITFAVSSWPASAPLYIAYDKGYFRDEGLDVTLQSYISGHLGLAAVFSGKADVAVAGDTPIARAALDGKTFAVIATIAEITQAIQIIARKDRGISMPANLRGKKIGLVAGTTADFFLHIYLATSYINPQNVKIVDLPPERVVSALLNGEVDAVSTWSPYTIMLREKLGSDAVILEDPSIYRMTWNVVAAREFIRNHPEHVEKLLRAIVRANEFIATNPAETRVISSRHIGADSDLFENEWKNYHFTAVLDQSFILNLEDQARWMFKKQDNTPSTNVPNFVDFMYGNGLKAVEPGAVNIPGK